MKDHLLWTTIYFNGRFIQFLLYTVSILPWFEPIEVEIIELWDDVHDLGGLRQEHPQDTKV